MAGDPCKKPAELHGSTIVDVSSFNFSDSSEAVV
jgi:hypothetical protein